VAPLAAIGAEQGQTVALLAASRISQGSEFTNFWAPGLYVVTGVSRGIEAVCFTEQEGFVHLRKCAVGDTGLWSTGALSVWEPLGGLMPMITAVRILLEVAPLAVIGSEPEHTVTKLASDLLSMLVGPQDASGYWEIGKYVVIKPLPLDTAGRPRAIRYLGGTVCGELIWK
jgi:hypothetical protein